MKTKHYLANSILWAAAIIASAIAGAPSYFTLMLLPILAASALLMTLPKAGSSRCRLS